MTRLASLAAASTVLAIANTPASFAADRIVLGRAGMSNVFVWRDSDAQSEALRLIDAGVYQTNPALVLRNLSCIASPGDHAIVTDGGFFSSTIMVIDGGQAGCRGVIANEDLTWE